MNIFKKILSVTVATLALSASLPFGVYAAAVQPASGEPTYLVNQNFDGCEVGSSNGITGVSVATDTTDPADKSGNITVELEGSTVNVGGTPTNKAIKYDKKYHRVNANGGAKDACFTDIKPDSGIKDGYDFVIEFSFWYTGTILGYDFGSIVQARKIDAKFIDFLSIKNGYLVDANGNQIVKLTANSKFNIAVSVHDAAAKYDVYVNGIKLVVDREFNKDYEQDYSQIRAINLTNMKKSDGSLIGEEHDYPEFYGDNFKLYYADKPASAGGVPSSVPTTSTGSTGGNNNNNNDNNTDDIGGGAIVTPPTTNDKETLVQDATTKGPNIGDLTQNINDNNSFNFDAPSSSSNNDVNTPSSPVTENTKDVTIMLAVTAGALLIIILGVLFSKKTTK